MASASSSAARSLIRDGKSLTNLFLRGRKINLTETVQNNGPAIRSLLCFNQMPAASQYPVYSETFPVMKSGLRVGFVQKEAVSERVGKMEAAHGKRVVDNKDADSEEDTDFDEDEIDDVDFEDDEDSDEDDEEEEDDKYTRKKK
ncbi:hypothetical protein AtNW77_Chr3g0172071 [Arabidopsis thaliana]|uniref:At3g15357 n=4 Tax=Arabidopsis TaxID=3701 RepID=Q8LDR8_ARATH|nr:phosphopantothenoylcysteine decarboxylase subunit [Arabidopsis thaliana]KAG7625332.1 hypothetical protein ISN45_At03g015770 [Arabidopsis thaliana x Arabidopsis arenosa]KAG7631343.1 hypothetical protein ISN44_As03g015800 [Arabidopsis suecica]AAM63056.1 unknown [Arabidopsis thaliana]ABD60703.1 At3g15357 [Arabidopsis thaliana]AEE75658.1 phosphopantothenoylcysteine decarboxylase subunit [Arabidopsis thaliana]|eukprot:NP_566510.1 phosphopantothenoylcysteine decarboxylase subunit [Arabidopsis thaliana]